MVHPTPSQAVIWWVSSFINKWQVNRPQKRGQLGSIDMCNSTVLARTYRTTTHAFPLLHYKPCIIWTVYVYDPFISALLRGLLHTDIAKTNVRFWGCHDSVVCVSAHFGEYLSSMGRFRMFGWQASFVPEKNQWRSGRVRPVVCGVAEVWIRFRVISSLSTKKMAQI